MIPKQKIKICVMGRNCKIFKNLGYQFKNGDYIYVDYEDLLPTSSAEIKVICDVCGKEFLRDKRHILKSKNERDNLDYCKECAISVKRVKTCVSNFGVEYPMQSNIIKEKSKKTLKEHYEVENPSQSKKIREKIKQTTLNHYGVENVSQSEVIKDRKKETTKQHYGVEYNMQSEEIREKIKQTNLKNYGYEYPMQCPSIREKAIKSFVSNNTINASKQEIELFELLKEIYHNKYTQLEHTYACGNFILDIFMKINNVKIDIEYDGKYWHQDKRRDLIRDKIIQKQGYKTLRIKAINTIPTKEQIIEKINILINTDKMYVHIDL